MLQLQVQHWKNDKINHGFIDATTIKFNVLLTLTFR